MATVSDIVLVWISIALEALPFVLAGSVLAVMIEHLVPERWMQALAGGSTGGGLFGATMIGIVLPVCDCAAIPMTRRLVSRGMPPSRAAAFLCASSSVNPVVVAATWWAFPSHPEMAVARVITGVYTGLFAGFLVHAWRGTSALRPRIRGLEGTEGHVHGPGCGCDTSPTSGHRFADVLRSISGELLDTMGWVLIGGFIAACVQTLVPRVVLGFIGESEILAIPGAMLFAFLLGLCAHADAFVASSLSSFLPIGATLAFMSFGGMLDTKNLLMLLSGFKGRFVLLVASAMVATVFLAALLLEAVS